MSLGDSFSFLKHACLGLIRPGFCLQAVNCGGPWIRSPYTCPVWVWMTVLYHLFLIWGQQLFVEPRTVFASFSPPHLHSILFKGIGPNQQHFVGISPKCAFFIIVAISVSFLLFQSSKGAVS